MWFAISEAGLDPISAVTNTVLAGGRGRSGVEVGPDQIRVQMGDFKLTVPRASIRPRRIHRCPPAARSALASSRRRPIGLSRKKPSDQPVRANYGDGTGTPTLP